MKDYDTPPSAGFLKAIETGGGGGEYMECGCGRVYFCEDSAFHGEENSEFLTRMRRRAALNPDKVIECSEDEMRTVEIDGGTYVVGCKCNRLGRYEAFIWRERRMIARYLSVRVKEELEIAKLEAALVGDRLDEVRVM